MKYGGGLVTGLALAGCIGGSSSGGAPGGESPTATPSPTATETPEPTQTDTPGPRSATIEPVREVTFEASPERAREAVERGHLRLRTREALPYGLAVFDDRVGIGGYDDRTGAMEVFVDTDSPIDREWAERVYRSVRADSEPLELDAER